MSNAIGTTNNPRVRREMENRRRNAAAPCPSRRVMRREYRRLPDGRARRRSPFALAGAVALALVAAFAWQTAPGTPDILSAGKSALDAFSPAQSTPRSQWAYGMPTLYQTDPAWADAGYAGETIGDSGCGPTCLSMVHIALTGSTDYAPPEMCAFSEENGFAEDGATLWTLMSEGAARIGLHSEELPADASRVLANLRAGNPIICIMGPGEFTTTGHFIVLSGATADGLVEIKDPNSPARTQRLWSIEEILPQCRNLWAFTAV